MHKPRILIVDDDAGMRKYLGAALRAEGYDTEAARDGEEALGRAGREAFDLVLLDLEMPGPDGFAICRALRERNVAPVIMVSAHGDEPEKVRALDLGADDYITKPFGMPELLARARVALRRGRSEPVASDRLVAGDLTIDFAGRRVCRTGADIKLTPTEYELLTQLARYPNMVLTHTMLLQRVWGTEYRDEHDYLWVYIWRLRRKIEPDPEHPTLLLTEPGVGYRFRATPA